MTRGRLGTLFIILGVSAWVPFLGGRIAGADPPFFLFLALHLAGVLVGAYLRHGQRGPVPRTRRLGNVLIYLGVSAWIPYFSIDALGNEPPLLPFLLPHLSGVIPGVVLRYFQDLRRLWDRISGRRGPSPAAPPAS